MRFSELTAASGAVDPFPGDQADKQIDDKRYRYIHTQLGKQNAFDDRSEAFIAVFR